MQDLKLLESKGATHEKFKALFTADKKSDGIKKLTELHADRLRRAIDNNLVEAPIYGAIDRALEASKDNLPYIQARQLATEGKTAEEVMKALEDFGLKNLLEPVTEVVNGRECQVLCADKKTPLLAFNKPLFESVVVPLVAAYRDMRVGKLFNDRNQFPRYPYPPARMTTDDMIIADIVTDRVQRMSAEMGYANDDKQSIQQMASYGICFNFPKESYHRELYTTLKEGKETDKVQREGVRFVIPHPTRHFYDKSCPIYTFNTDTGVKFSGYWDILRWSEIKDNPLYWNRDKITRGGYDLFTTATWRTYNMYYPCVIKAPPTLSEEEAKKLGDRVAKEQSNFLTNELDATVTHAVLFDKLNPKQWGLFEYDKEVWMRFIYVNFDCCVHCEVLPYTPGYVYLDRIDANKTVPDSMCLKMVPFAQLLGNFLTQHFISVKQNLMRIAFVNTDIVPAEQFGIMKRMKDKLYQGIQFFNFSKKRDSFLADDKREAVTPMSMAQVDTQQLQANINLTLTALERIIGMSPQEVGQPASHEQSAGEVNIIAGNTSNSLEYMATGIDDAWVAKKRLLYTAFYCYGTDEIFAEVADLTPERESALKKMGFKVEKGGVGATHAGVQGSKGALVMDTFFSDREGVNRLSDSKLGIAMLQNLGVVAQNPVLFQAVGVPQFIKLFNQIWAMVGLPADFRLRADQNAAQSPEDQQQAAVQLIEQAKQVIVQEAVAVTAKYVDENVTQPVTKEFADLSQTLQQMQAQDQVQNAAIEKLLQMMQAVTQPPPPQIVPALPMGQPTAPPILSPDQPPIINAPIQPGPDPALLAPA